MNTPKNIRFSIDKRTNVHNKGGVEWALSGCMNGDWWTFVTYNTKPSDRKIKRDKDLIMRSFEIYHNHISIPQWRMTEYEF